MKEKLRFLGLDVHAETIAVAVAEPEGEVRSLGTIPNRAESIRKLIKKLGPADKLRACYEAGPTGYVVYWQLAELGVECEVVAPTLVPVKAGDRVKTDRRDAEKLARCYRSGDLTAVWGPDEGSEALRDLVRAREAAKQDQTRARHRECTGTSVTLWTGDLHYKSLVLQRPWIRSLLVLHLEICQQSRLWECGNPAGISKECGKGGKPVSWLSMLSILCHFHGLLWKRASHNQNPAEALLSTGTVCPNRLDVRIGDSALIDDSIPADGFSGSHARVGI